jgi:hypothetical protein
LSAAHLGCVQCRLFTAYAAAAGFTPQFEGSKAAIDFRSLTFEVTIPDDAFFRAQCFSSESCASQANPVLKIL